MGRRLASLMTIGLARGGVGPGAPGLTGGGRHLPRRVHRHHGGRLARVRPPAWPSCPTAGSWSPPRPARCVSSSGSSATLALDLAPRPMPPIPTVCGASEEGLLGVTVDPQFATERLRLPLLHARRERLVLRRRAATPGGGREPGVALHACRATPSPAPASTCCSTTCRSGAATTTAATSTSPTTARCSSPSATAAPAGPTRNSADLSLPNGKILRINTDGIDPGRQPARHDRVRHDLGAARQARRAARSTPTACATRSGWPSRTTTPA